VTNSGSNNVSVIEQQQILYSQCDVGTSPFGVRLSPAGMRNICDERWHNNVSVIDTESIIL